MDQKIPTTIMISQKLKERIEAFVSSPVSPVKSKRMLFEEAITDYLDREEPIVDSVEKEIAKIRGKYR